MRKIILYFFSFIIICFILPAICTTSFKMENSSSTTNEHIVQNEVEIVEENIAEKFDYGEYTTIKLLHTEKDEKEEVELDEYLYGVVAAEMPASYEIEALKAQAVVARTYTIYQIKNNGQKHGDANICDSYACCQAWISKEERMNKWEESEKESNWEKIVSAVNDTRGKIITYDGEPINAFFHSNSGGATESSVNVWSGIEYPYLKSVETSGEEGYSQYSSEVSFSKEELVNKIKESYNQFEIDWNEENPIQIQEYTDSGRVRTIKIGNINIAGAEARTLLGLRSTNFTISYDSEKIKFSVIGYGHGVGMSQTGADSLAKQGKKHEEIIKHFYSGVEISNCK